MVGRVQGLAEGGEGEAVGAIFVGLPTFVFHHIPLAIHLFWRHGVEQVAHPVGLQEKRQLQPVAGYILVIIRPVPGGRAVIVAAGGLQPLVEFPLGHIPRSLEHDVLEEVRKASTARLLAAGADVVPHVDAYERRRVVLVDKDGEAVVECELAVGDVDVLGGNG